MGCLGRVALQDLFEEYYQDKRRPLAQNVTEFIWGLWQQMGNEGSLRYRFWWTHDPEVCLPTLISMMQGNSAQTAQKFGLVNETPTCRGFSEETGTMPFEVVEHGTFYACMTSILESGIDAGTRDRVYSCGFKQGRCGQAPRCSGRS